MKIKILIPGFWRHLIHGVEEILVNGNTVGECLAALVEQLPQLKVLLFEQDGVLKSYIEIFINQRSAYPDELSKKVCAGDEIQIVNVIAGG
jgi:molybdopterin converting factor small subunit